MSKEITSKEDTTNAKELIENEDAEVDVDLDIRADFSPSDIADSSKLRGKAVMYTQDLDRVIKIWGSLDNFIHCVETLLCNLGLGDKYALIIHDKDKSEKPGQLMALPHIHLALEFVNARYLSSIAKTLKDFRDDGSLNVQTLTIFRGKVGNLYSYLCHRTTRASSKYQYDPAIVKASFDYVDTLNKITASVNVARHTAEAKHDINLILEEMKAGVITLQQVEKMLPANVYSQRVVQLQNVWKLAMKLEAEKWRENLHKSGRQTRVIWIWGHSGTGKSSLGRDLVVKDSRPFYIAGSSRGMWDGYETYMHIALLDECRPDMFETYRDMLSILDNFQVRAVAPARYYDRELALDTIVITTVYNPYEFYRHMNIADREIDEFYQLQRRITHCIYMDESYIYNSSFNPRTKQYDSDINSFLYNPYSEFRRGSMPIANNNDYRNIVLSAYAVAKHYDAMNEDIDEIDALDEDTLLEDEFDSASYDDCTIEDIINLIEADDSDLDDLEDLE